MGIVVVRGRHTGAPVWLEGEGVIFLWGSKVRLFICVLGDDQGGKEACLYSKNLLIQMSIKPEKNLFVPYESH